MTGNSGLRSRLLLSLQLVLVVLGLRAWLSIVWEYRWYFPPDFEQATFLIGRKELFHGLYKLAFYGHILSSPLAIGINSYLLVTSSSIRKGLTRGRYHRYLGRVSIFLVLMGVAPSGLVMAWGTFHGLAASIGFTAHSLLTFCFALATIRSAVKRDFVNHGVFAMRCWLMLCGPLLFRLLAGLSIVLGLESIAFYQVNAWVSWLIPWLAFEASRWKLFLPIAPVRTSWNLMVKKPNEPLMSKSVRSAFTWLELIVVIGIIVVLFALLLPFTRTSGEAARRMACGNNLKSLGLAISNYESSFRTLPNCMGGTAGINELNGNMNRLSGVISLLPFLDQSALYERISHELQTEDRVYPSMGPAPWVESYEPWKSNILRSLLNCPSAPRIDSPISGTSYAFCVGDLARDLHAPRQPRGVFAPGFYRKWSEISDGQSNTISIAEIGRLSGRSVMGNYALGQPTKLLEQPSQLTLLMDKRNQYVRIVRISKAGRGANWVDGTAANSMFNTIISPNGPSAMLGEDPLSDGFYSAGGHHVGIVQTLFADGSVRPLSNDIDVGDLNLATPPSTWDAGQPSPYGLWGSLGTVDGGEVVADEF